MTANREPRVRASHNIFAWLSQGLGDQTQRLRTACGIVTNAYGLGSGYNEEIMQAIATGGGGRYAFVDDKRIGKAMGQALDDVVATVATDARLFVQVR